MKQRLNHSSNQNLEGETQHQTPDVEFESVEEMIRHDAAQTEVPGHLFERLKTEIAAEQKPVPWWRKWFS